MRSEHGTGNIAKCLRLMLYDKPGYLADVATEIARHNARIGDIRLVRAGRTHNTRDLVIFVSSEEQLEDVIDGLTLLEGIVVEDVTDLVQEIHHSSRIRGTYLRSLQRSQVRSGLCRREHGRTQAGGVRSHQDLPGPSGFRFRRETEKGQGLGRG